MVTLEDITSLSEFQRNTRSHIKKLGKTGRPEVLTINGKAKLVVQDALAYQKLLEEVEEARTRASIESAMRGEGIPFEKAMTDLRRRMKSRKAR